MGGVDGVEGLEPGDALPADDQRMLAAEFGLHFLERGLHGRFVLGFAEVDESLVFEIGQTSGNLGLVLSGGGHL